MTRPNSTSIQPEHIPPALQHVAAWCTWEYIYDRPGSNGTRVPLLKPGKRPHQWFHRDPRYLTFEEAISRLDNYGVDGLGFGFTSANPYVGIDIDEDTEASRGVFADARAKGAYIERSPSGEGWHIIARGKMTRERGIGSGLVPGVEMYDQGRFFTMTGREAGGDPDVDIQALVDRIEADAPPVGAGRAESEVVERVIAGFEKLGMTWDYRGELVDVTCPWKGEHTTGTDGDTSTTVGLQEGFTGFRCLHSHCSERTLDTVIDWLGTKGISVSASEVDEFEVAELDLGEWDSVREYDTTPPAEWVAMDLAALPEEPPPRRWAWRHHIPRGVVTGLSGPPGVAKSLLGLQLCVEVVEGGTFHGEPLEQGAAVFVTTEDDELELHHRLHNMCERLMMTEWRQTLAGRLHVFSIGEELPQFVKVDRDSDVTPTQELDRFEAVLAGLAPKLVVLDLVTDFWNGSENIKAEVTPYIRKHLGGMARRLDCGMLVLSHPSVTGEREGRAFGGSYGHLGSYRAGLYLTRPEPDRPDELQLTQVKINGGRPGWTGGLRFSEGALMEVQEGEREAERREERAGDIAAVVEALRLAARDDGWATKHAVWVALGEQKKPAKWHKGYVGEVLTEATRSVDNPGGVLEQETEATENRSGIRQIFRLAQ